MSLKNTITFLICASILITLLIVGLSNTDTAAKRSRADSRYVNYGLVTMVEYNSQYDSYKISFDRAKPITLYKLDTTPDMLIGKYCEIITDGNGNIIHLTISNYEPPSWESK